MNDGNWVVALDGSKGAGKSTTVALFKKLHPDVSDISLDFVRSDIGIVGTSFKKNKIAFEEVKRRVFEILKSGDNVILDCGLNEYRIKEIRSIAAQAEAKVVFIFLSAPYDVLIDRVKKRDEAKGKIFNIDRFDEVYKIVMGKDFSKFTVVDTADKPVPEVVEVIDTLTSSL